MTRFSMVQRVSRIHWIPGVFVAAFSMIVAVNGALIWFATSSFSGLDTDRAYEEGLAYNEALRAAAESARLGWFSELAIEESAGNQFIVLGLTDKNGDALQGLILMARLIRPTDASLDRGVAFTEVAPGRYRSAPLEGLARGQWELRAAAIDTGWQMSRRIVLE